MENFYLNQIFEKEYPEEAVDFCRQQGLTITEIDPAEGEDGIIRRFQITEIPPEDEISKQERIAKLFMTRYDFYKYVVAPNGITYDELEEIINTNSDMKAAWNLCGNVYRGDEILCSNIKNFIPTMTDELLTTLFEQYGTQGE